ncbi:nitroreductase/quinone reductase family protein [Amycolatopsis silviterrae]|uniref:Nitroreductase/quinone reductase family protein n=1 Tax=Amycolatopsis silviterrae TaxID=1656914 RepID=A0ABW5HB16_9PSEU
MRANPDARVEVGDQTVNVRAVELEPAERDEKYRAQAERYPGFAEYQRKTDRVIPVIALVPDTGRERRPRRRSRHRQAR